MTTENSLNIFFEKFINKDPMFLNKKYLQSNFTPEEILHRDDEIKQIADILAPSLRLDKPSNLFIYGKTGTGKTVSIKFIINKIENISKQKNIPIKIIYLNCKLKKVADTEYRLIAQLANEFGQQVPITGLPTDEVYNIFFSIVDKEKKLVFIILDEIDQLAKKAGDEILYNLTRINSELKNAQISLIGISNNLIFRDNLDPRVKSSLSEEELTFPPYNAMQIQSILRQRAKKSFKKEVIKQGVIEKCAAYAAREHGDARRALELLRVSGEIAERKNLDYIGIEHIDEAEEKIEKDKVFDIVNTQPKQHQATLFSILKLSENNKTVLTGDIYALYTNICSNIGLRPLTQRRVSDIIAELDMLGIINAKVISKGRYGRTREISLALIRSTEDKIKTKLEEELELS